MKLKIFFPIIDLRSFVGGDINKLNHPTWPFPTAKEFIKYHGQVKVNRLKNGQNISYCNAPNIFKFKDVNVLTRELKAIGVKKFNITKRLFVLGNENVDVFLEVTLNFKISKHDSLYLTDSKVQTVLVSFLHSSLSFPSRKESKKTYIILDLVDELKSIYLKATTKNTGYDKIEKWWVSSSQPFIVFQNYSPRLTSKTHDLLKLGNGKSFLAKKLIKIQTHDLEFWEIGLDPNNETSSGCERQIIAMSLFSESLKSTARSVISKKLFIEPWSKQSNSFQYHINDSIKALTKSIDKESGVDERIRKELLLHSYLFNDQEIQAILREFNWIRKNVLRRLANYMKNKSGLPEAVNDLNLQVKEDELFKDRRYLKQRIFVSYVREDKNVLERITVHIRPIIKKAQYELWSNDRILPGRNTKKEIENALKRSCIAILILSADYLASDSIFEHQLPLLLRMAESEQIDIIPLIARPCAYEEYDELKYYKPINRDNIPLESLTQSEKENLLVELAKKTKELLP